MKNRTHGLSEREMELAKLLMADFALQQRKQPERLWKKDNQQRLWGV